MFRDKETLGIIALLVFVVAIISTGCFYIYNDTAGFENKSSDKEEKKEYNFTLKVKEKDGNPVEGALVKIKIEDVNLSKKSDKDGYVFFPGLSTKNFSVQVSADGLQTANEWLRAGEAAEIILNPLKIETVNILTLHGSNTIGARFAPRLAEDYLKKIGCSDVSVKIKDNQEEKVITGKKNNIILTIDIEAYGSSTGFKSLEAGKCDIAMASRKIKKKEVEKLKFVGDMESFASEHISALDGIAVIVHPSNTIKSASVSLLNSIFKGDITNWKDTGAIKNGKIQVYARDNNSGTFDTFKKLVLNKQPLVKNAKRYDSNQKLSDDVAENRFAIGFTGLPYIGNSKAIGVYFKGGAKVFPTFFTVATEDYPLSRRLYFYSPSVPENSHVNSFINHALSDRGQKIARDLGFADLAVKEFTHKIEEDYKYQNKKIFNQYLKAVKKGKRLSVNFRFRTNSYILDNRAQRDLKRVVSFLEKDENFDKKVILAGFTDSHGDYMYNYDLGSKRVKVISDELRARGIINIEEISVSEELPVASNLNNSGRSKNRRVEVWLKD
ncbi:MAG: substrate-binding domain-containing protein [Nanobdellota archaeon]